MQQKELYSYNLLPSCLCCGSQQLYQYLSLGYQPLCNAFHDKKQEQSTYPLFVKVCMECWHSQLSIAVRPDVLFNKYPYRTGVSQTLKDHYNELALSSIKKLDYIHDKEGSVKGFPEILKVLDIGCNDGTLLGKFKDNCLNQTETTGVDICKVEYDETWIDRYIESPWGMATSNAFSGEFDILCGTNVLAHNSYPKEFMRYCGVAMKRFPEHSIAVFEFPYAVELLHNCEFDTIYHEHISYFLLHSFVSLLNNTGLRICNVEVNSIHGGSIRIFLTQCHTGEEKYLHCKETKKIIFKELESGYLTLPMYKNFQDRVDRNRSALQRTLDHCNSTTSSVVGFGASGKGTVLTNYARIDMAYIIDETPSKIGLYNPGRNIPIYGLEKLEEDPCVLTHVILSWNCMEESLQKIRKAREKWGKNDAVVTYIPEVKHQKLFS